MFAELCQLGSVNQPVLHFRCVPRESFSSESAQLPHHESRSDSAVLWPSRSGDDKMAHVTKSTSVPLDCGDE